MPRNLGGIPPAVYKDERLVPFYFARMIWPAPTGTLYWTTHPADSYTHDVGFGAVAWDGTKIIIPGQFEQGDQGVLSVSDITFGNADLYFSGIMKLQTYGCRGIPVEVWEVPFTKDPPHVPEGGEGAFPGVLLFQGLLDRAEVSNEAVRTSLRPLIHPLSLPYPQRRYALNWGFRWLPPQNLKFNFGSAGQVTLPTAHTPITPSTTGGAPPGGVPPPGDINNSPTTRMPIVRIDPTTRRHPGTPGQMGGRNTRTVTR